MSNQEALTFTGELDPTIQHILNRPSLKWIFVGGKGGVGKTTNSSCLAVQLAKVRQSVLIISTDPAHNLSDAFNQKFTKSPTLVQGFQNLYAMEIDPNIETDDIFGEQMNNHPEMAMFQDMALNFPGIDEAMSFAEVMKQVQSMEFTTIIFDTAPTGHTLRLLSFPSTLEKVLGKLTSLKSKFGGMFQQFSSMLNMGADTEESMNNKMESTLKVIREINKQFTNPEMTTFVCVCIPEFLSLYETERLIQELAKFQIDTDTIIVNQVLFPDEDSKCDLCNARSNMQKKYLRQIHDLYEDFHVLILPLLKHEIRGTEKLQQFGEYQLKPYPGIKKLQF